MKKDFASETELAEYIVNWLKEQGWEVYQEVQFNSIADIVAVKNNQSWIVECKTTFGISVLEQAHNWRQMSNYISIAIPYPNYKKHHICNELANALKIGVLCVTTKNWEGNRKVEELIKAPLQEEIVHNIITRLNEKQKTWALAGNNRGERYTDFKDTVNQIYEYLKKHPDSTLKDIIKNIKHHYRKDSTAQSSISTWIRKGIIKNIDVKLIGNKYLYNYKEK